MGGIQLHATFSKPTSGPLRTGRDADTIYKVYDERLARLLAVRGLGMGSVEPGVL